MKTKISDISLYSNIFTPNGKRWRVIWISNRSKYGLCGRSFKTRREAREFKRKKMIHTQSS